MNSFQISKTGQRKDIFLKKRISFRSIYTVFYQKSDYICRYYRYGATNVSLTTIMDKGFNEIEISNFRGFDHIKIDRLARLNVFVGANNVGKSSILESVFMLCGMGNPLMPARVNYWRAQAVNSMESTKYLFHNIDFNNRPILVARSASCVRRLTFSPFLQSEVGIVSGDTSINSEIKKLNFDFDVKEEGDFSYHATLFTGADGALQQTVDANYQEVLNCLFIPADKNDGNATHNFATLVKRNRKRSVIDALREFDPDIESVEALPDGLYLVMKGLHELLPISMAGDGVRRIINILSTVASEDYNIIMVDELDNGLHYSAHRLIWKILLEYIDKHNIQLFVTTHNLECLQSLEVVMRNNEKFQSLANIYNIAKTKRQGFQAYRYSFDGFKEAIDNEIEIRQ